MRRGGVSFGRRHGFRGIGGGYQTPTLDLFSGGTFTRSTEASYLISAPTDGSSAFLAWAATNARRIEDRGDGLGSMLLMEGARTNLVTQSRNMGTSWTAGTATLTVDDGNGPDATAVADRSNGASGQLSQYKNFGALTGRYIASAWARRRTGAGAGNAQYSVEEGAVIDGYVEALTETYERLSFARTFSGVDIAYYVPAEGRAGGPFSAAAVDHLLDLHQFEAGAFPSSAIRTTTAAVTRGADVLSYAVGQYSPTFLTRGFRFTFAPIYSSTELIAVGADTDARLFTTDATTYIRLVISGGNCILQTNNGGGVAHNSTITFSRDQLITVTVEPTAGRTTVSGATTGNGTASGNAASWVSAAMQVGGQSGSQPSFSRFGRTVVGV